MHHRRDLAEARVETRGEERGTRREERGTEEAVAHDISNLTRTCLEK
jgi:hypothetical protein